MLALISKGKIKLQSSFYYFLSKFAKKYRLSTQRLWNNVVEKE